MKIIQIILLSTLLSNLLYAQKEDVSATNIKLNYETLDFENSKIKENGQRYGVEFAYRNKQHHYRLSYEKTDTNTQDTLPNNLEVHKYALNYQYQLNKKNALSFSYINVYDNLMKEIDGRNIYGIGYKYRALAFMQYLSDYRNFNVYQSDVKLGIKRDFGELKFMGGVITKYIYLEDKNSNKVSKKANKKYLTTGINLHAHYHNYHFGVATYLGEHIFTVMDSGMRVQHRPMEFNDSYMLLFGRNFSNLSVDIRYAKHQAKEIPIDHDNVTVENIALEVSYQF